LNGYFGLKCLEHEICAMIVFMYLLVRGISLASKKFCSFYWYANWL